MHQLEFTPSLDGELSRPGDDVGRTAVLSCHQESVTAFGPGDECHLGHGRTGPQGEKIHEGPVLGLLEPTGDRWSIVAKPQESP